jgi:hypothetical protein
MPVQAPALASACHIRANGALRNATGYKRCILQVLRAGANPISTAGMIREYFLHVN